jgi:hypothetical protein
LTKKALPRVVHFATPSWIPCQWYESFEDKTFCNQDDYDHIQFIIIMIMEMITWTAIWRTAAYQCPCRECKPFRDS